MAVSLTRFSWWLWGGHEEKEPVSKDSSINSSSSNERTFGDSVKFPSTRIASTPRKVKKKWQSREERRMDRDFDVVLVPSDGGVYSCGSESDDSDWSIGWLEPHGPDFRSDDESDNSFAVLVPCYRLGCKELVEGSNNQMLNAIKNLAHEFSPEGNKLMEQCLSSLRTSEPYYYHHSWNGFF